MYPAILVALHADRLPGKMPGASCPPGTRRKYLLQRRAAPLEMDSKTRLAMDRKTRLVVAKKTRLANHRRNNRLIVLIT